MSEYRRAPRLTTFLRVMLLVSGAVPAVGYTIGLVGAFLYPQFTNLEAEFSDRLEQALFTMLGVIAWVQLSASIITAIAFIVWLYRANLNARALGAAGMQYGPGACVWTWIIPVANLFMPFLVVREVYLASDPEKTGDGWRGSPAPNLLAGWWLSWIAGQTLELAYGRVEFSDPLLRARLGLAAGALILLASILARRIVGLIHARQERRCLDAATA